MNSQYPHTALGSSLLGVQSAPSNFFTHSDTDSQLMHLLPASLNKVSFSCMKCRENKNNPSVASAASAFSILTRSELRAAPFPDFGSTAPKSLHCSLLIPALPLHSNEVLPFKPSTLSFYLNKHSRSCHLAVFGTAWECFGWGKTN